MYTIIRKSYGFQMEIDLSTDEDCFLFDTYKEAKKCLSLLFNNGEWMQDERYGKVRYYIQHLSEEYIRERQNRYAQSMAFAEMGGKY